MQCSTQIGWLGLVHLAPAVGTNVPRTTAAIPMRRIPCLADSMGVTEMFGGAEIRTPYMVAWRAGS